MLAMKVPSLHQQQAPHVEEHDYESLPANYNFTTHMMAGAIAGLMEHSSMYAVDSVKTRMQSLHPNPRAVYRSVFDALRKMVRQEGITRPFRGVSLIIFSAGPAHALYFSCYEKMKRVFSGTETGNQNPLAQVFAGCLSTLLHDAVMNPAEVVKQRLQMYNSKHKKILSCASSIWKNEGLKAFYRSYTTQLVMNIPFHCVHLVSYEYSQELTNPERQYNPKTHIFCGAVAGAVAGAATTPFDVCKTLINTQEEMTLTATKQKRISGLINAVRTIYRCCGFRGFFNGLQARVIYSTPSTAISWSVYEFFKALLKKEPS